jgi:curli production assembly/transport component CsgG
MKCLRIPTLLATALWLAGCQALGTENSLADRPTVVSQTRTSAYLSALAPPPRPVNIAVYSFPDRTGAHRPNARYADYSKAVTQGADAIVVNALKMAGRGRWFNVVERSNLDDLLRERKLISDTYSALGKNPLQRIAPLQLADFIVQGQITSFDSKISSGGIGASYLGVGADVNFRKDYVTVALRLTRTATGDVVKSITAHKTIYSIEMDGSIFKVISVDDVFNAVATFTRSEVTQIAINEAIELAVYQLIQQGRRDGTWRTPQALAANADLSDEAILASQGLKPATPE